MGEYEKSGAKHPPFEEILADIEQRDHNDMTREVGPLKQAEDAILLDTDEMTIEDQINFVVNLAQERASAQTAPQKTRMTAGLVAIAVGIGAFLLTKN
jgi:cytidylate kinase